MRIEGLRRVERAGRVRAEAEIVWENRDLPTRTLHFEVPLAFDDDFDASADAFLLACAPLACWYGEARVWIDGPVCPVLYENALSCLLVMQRFHPRLEPPSVEVERGFDAPEPRSPTRTASMMSGGVDALTLLRSNRLDYPLDHPHSIRDCLCFFGLYGFDHDEDVPVPARITAWEDLAGRLEALGKSEHFSLLPIFTNVRSFCADFEAWSHVLYSSLSVAGAHCVRGRFDRLLVASDGGGLEPMDCAASQYMSLCFSSAALDVRSELDRIDRLERTRILADWEAGRSIVQPCHWVEVPERGQINCGHCEKCIRTMLAFVVVGRLHETDAFTADDVAPEQIESLKIASRAKLEHLTALAAPLKRTGRKDLARALRRLQRRTDRRLRKRGV